MPLSVYPQGGQIITIADTGCQSCIIGLKLVRRLGFRLSDLLLVDHRVSAANKQVVNIIGAVILHLRGSHLESTQICYVTPETEIIPQSRDMRRARPHLVIIPNSW